MLANVSIRWRLDEWVSVLGVAPLISIKALCCYSNRILYDDICYRGRKAAREHNSRIMSA